MVQLSFTCITENGDKIFQYTLGDDTRISNLKPLIEAQLGIPSTEQSLSCSNKPLSDSQTLSQGGVKDGDVIVVKREQREFTSFEQLPPHVMQNTALFQAAVKNSPKLLQQLMNTNPTLAEAVMAEGTFMLDSYFAEQQRARQQQQLQSAQRIQRLNDDPFNLNAQAEIEKEIQQSNINKNYEAAIEHMPEAFARVVMLYVPAEVNGKSVTAFVDSGAQSTIMSEACAKRINLMHMVDTRFAGMAKGVGTAKIIGRVHTTLIKIGKCVLNVSITVLEGDSMDFLFGLDMLKRHQICIDLKKNCLTINDQDVPFLSEKDIPSIEGGLGSPRQAITSPRTSSTQSERKEYAPPATSSSSSSTSAPTSAPASSAASSSSSSSSSSGSGGGSASAVSSLFQNPPRSAGGGGQQASPFPQSSIDTLVNNMGVNRAQAIQALTFCGGNVELAASYLFQRGGGGF